MRHFIDVGIVIMGNTFRLVGLTVRRIGDDILVQGRPGK